MVEGNEKYYPSWIVKESYPGKRVGIVRLNNEITRNKCTGNPNV